MALVVSFFWWMQAVAWGTPQAQWRVLILLMVGVVHLLVWSLPRLSDAVGRGWWWVILMAMLASSMPVAVMGLQWVREGRWEGPSRLALMRTAWQPARGRLGRRFGSAFGAQFWFEWRRFGWVLPGVAMTVYFVILPLIKMVMTKQGAGGDFGMVGAGLIVAAPLTVAGLLGAGVGDFGAAEPGGGLPEYLAVRPMSNGDFVLAKMAMALAASALTWAAAVLASWMWLPAPHDLGSAMAWGVPAWALLVLFTWKNLLGGMWASLTGRQWVAMVAMVVRLGGALRHYGGGILGEIQLAVSRVSAPMVVVGAGGGTGGQGDFLGGCLCLGPAAECHYRSCGWLHRGGLAAGRAFPGRLRALDLRRAEPAGPVGLDCAGGIFVFAAGRFGHGAGGHGVEPASLRQRGLRSFVGSWLVVTKETLHPLLITQQKKTVPFLIWRPCIE